MSERFFRTILKNLKFILIVSSIIFIGGSFYLILNWAKQASTFGDNILIEVFVGGLFLIIPILFGIFLGKKLKEIQFYDKIKNLLLTVKRHRENGDIEPEATRNLIVEFSNTLGNDVLEEDWLKNVIRVDQTYDTKDCGVCGLMAETVNEKCKYCKLNCFAWKE
jgi:hypothetical protein